MSPEQEFEIIKKFERENQNIFDKEKPFNTYRSKKITYGSKEHLQNLKDRFLNERQKDKEENNINKKNKQVSKKLYPL